jgi:hypothetical protein
MTVSWVQWRRVPERGSEHFHGPDRSAADHPPVPRGMTQRVDDGDDLRHGAHFGRIMAAYIASASSRTPADSVIMTAPGTLMMARCVSKRVCRRRSHRPSRSTAGRHTIDAAGRGTAEGLHYGAHVGAMLISFVALIALSTRFSRSAGSPAANLRLGVRARGWSLGVRGATPPRW